MSRKITAVVYASLDGVIENPEWSVPYFNEQAAKRARDTLFASDTLLLGRLTYEGFAQAWPTMPERPGLEGFAHRMNTLPKYVVSTTIEKTEWGPVTVIREDVVARVRALKEEPGGGILIYGVGRLAHTLLEHGLLDELEIWFHPVLVGTTAPGTQIVREGGKALLELAEATTFDSGVAVLSYRPASA
ncbi:pyrimidine reductase [Sphaerisporangium siamense]|uniref:Dihydrofolate reductase n=1 Tax=Sphaerisporangium siamense TaxID=795645 RepID=A0A7W7G942_9ACTN|nr:dihydrofolate reductase family protein [Sphaerisporangium siamense]MBB4702428.1 dihydrofolate reductase [Sphaerisporangium siamense]GII88937.1 pyrimidine reductase [Sphaerisporangium siamense]